MSSNKMIDDQGHVDKTDAVSTDHQPGAINLVTINRIALATILRKEVRRFSRIWVQTIVPPAINAVLYMLIFGSLIGSRITDMGGFRYIDFIVPGIIMMSVIINSYSNVVSSFFSSKMQNYIEELLVSPVSSVTIVVGYVGGGMARGLLVGTLVATVSLLFSEVKPVHPVITLIVAVLTSMIFALGGLINAVFAKSFDDIAIVPNFVLTPLTYLGGVFYSISLLPSFWQSVSLFNPVLYVINGFRFGILGSSDIPIWTSFLVITCFILFLGTIAMLLLNRGVGIKH